jgi:hypothetical protein
MRPNGALLSDAFSSLRAYGVARSSYFTVSFFEPAGLPSSITSTS